MKKYASIVYKLIIVFIGIIGLLIQLGAFGGIIDFSILNYYTLISNLICVIYFTCASVYSILNIKKKPKTFLPCIKGAVILSITVTMLIVLSLLSEQFPTTGLIGFSFIALHYIVPIMTILDWIIFDIKGNYKKYYPFIWILIPVIYYIYVVILVHTGYSFGIESKYPYPFQDVYKLGYSTVITTDIILLIFFIIIGYVYYYIDKKLSKK